MKVCTHIECVCVCVCVCVCNVTPDVRLMRLMVTSGFILQRVDIFGGSAPCCGTRPKERGCER